MGTGFIQFDRYSFQHESEGRFKFTESVLCLSCEVERIRVLIRSVAESLLIEVYQLLANVKLIKCQFLVPVRLNCHFHEFGLECLNPLLV